MKNNGQRDFIDSKIKIRIEIQSTGTYQSVRRVTVTVILSHNLQLLLVIEIGSSYRNRPN